MKLSRERGKMAYVRAISIAGLIGLGAVLATELIGDSKWNSVLMAGLLTVAGGTYVFVRIRNRNRLR